MSAHSHGSQYSININTYIQFSGDDMFLELPELCPLPFPRLESLEYEGSINSRVLDYLTSHAPRLVSMELRCGQSVLEPTCLR